MILHAATGTDTRVEPRRRETSDRGTVLLFCPRWYPVPISREFRRRASMADARYRRGDMRYPEDLAVKRTCGFEVPYLTLAVAAHLGRGGFTSEIIDLHLEVSLRHRVEMHRDKVLCVGIECERPYSMAEGSAIGRSLRSALPGVPIVWFGYAATLLATELCQEGLADAVVRGQPEITFADAVDSITARRPLRSVEGLTYRDGSNRVITNPTRPLRFDEDTPPPDYSRLPLDCYSLSRGHVVLRTSVGCASRCTFCWFPHVYGRQFAGLSAERVVDDLEALASRHDLDSVIFADQSFFQNRDRVRGICEGILRRGIQVRWRASGQIYLLHRYPIEAIDLLGRAGCTVIQTGIETGSRSLLKRLNKPFDAEMVLDTARRLQAAGIRLVANFIFGLPGETDDDFDDTWRLIREIGSIQPDLEIVYYHFMPFPGNALYEQLLDAGRVDHTPEGTDTLSWARFARDMEHPWFMQRYVRRIPLYYHVVAYDGSYTRRFVRGPLRERALSAYVRYARWRIRRGVYRFALDYHLARLRYTVRTKRCWRDALRIRVADRAPRGSSPRDRSSLAEM